MNKASHVSRRPIVTPESAAFPCRETFPTVRSLSVVLALASVIFLLGTIFHPAIALSGVCSLQWISNLIPLS